MQWPHKCAEEASLIPLWRARSQLTVHKDLLLCNNRIVIPDALRRDVLIKIHHGHQGTGRCRQRANILVCWPGITKQISQLVQQCPICARENAQGPLATAFEVVNWLYCIWMVPFLLLVLLVEHSVVFWYGILLVIVVGPERCLNRPGPVGVNFFLVVCCTSLTSNLRFLLGLSDSDSDWRCKPSSSSSALEGTICDWLTEVCRVGLTSVAWIPDSAL